MFTKRQQKGYWEGKEKHLGGMMQRERVTHSNREQRLTFQQQIDELLGFIVRNAYSVCAVPTSEIFRIYIVLVLIHNCLPWRKTRGSVVG
jgi:hypothetical protein